jgi:transposase InsO family protein
MELNVNMLLDWVTADGAQKTERVLRIEPSNERVVLIDIFDQHLMPYEISMPDLLSSGENGDFRVLTDDPYALTVVESEIPEKHRLRMERIWGLISPIIELPSGGAFDGTERFRVISKISLERGVPLISLYRYLRRFWKRGQTKYALLPDYKNCGAPGTERLPGEAKRGRPHNLTKIDGHERGKNIGPEDKRLIQLGMKLFYEDSKAPNPPSLRRAHKLLLAKYYSPGFTQNGGVRTPTHAPVHEVPSFGQVHYWYYKQRNLTETITAREGIRRFNLRHRALGGDAAADAPGPGSVFQIDSTPANINLVSSLDSTRPIGRPVLYFIVDVFTRMIVGYTVTLEEESYPVAMLALENALTNKVEYCASYGIQILPEEWPCHHIPEAVVADRGEMISKNANHLADELGIQITNTPAHRPDLKAFVERSFRSAQDEVIHHLPGAVHQRHERGDRDERLDAVLTLEDFRKIVIHFILCFNRSRIEGFRPQEFMLTDKVEPRPIDLWSWGVTHRAGHLRTMSSDLVRINLLPRSEGTATERGIRFRKLFYTCDTEQKQQWRVKARSNHAWKVEVAYDPLNTNALYYVSQTGFELCRLLEVAEVALDSFTVTRKGKPTPLLGREIEIKSRDANELLYLGQCLSNWFGLIRVTSSKIERYIVRLRHVPELKSQTRRGGKGALYFWQISAA